jgi:hypothetical protein
VVVRTAQHDDGFYKKARASDRAWTVVDPVRTTSLLSMNFIIRRIMNLNLNKKIQKILTPAARAQPSSVR